MNTYLNYHKHDHVSNIFTIDSNAKQEDYIKRCKELGQSAYFTTNHGSFGDIFEAKTLCSKYDIKCIAGIEAYVVPNPREKDKRNFHLIIIPRTDAARKKVNYISSRANAEGYYYKPRMFPEDIIALDPDDAYLTTACVAGILRDDDSINQLFIPFMEHFGHNLFLEVQNHNVDIQKEINKKALAFHEQYGLRLIAANDSHYIDDEGRKEREILLRGKDMYYEDEADFTLDFPDYDTMFRRFEMQGVLTEQQIEDAIGNTLLLGRCEEIQLDHSIKMPTIDPELTPFQRVEKLKSIIVSKFKDIAKDENISGKELQKYLNGIRYEMKIIEDTNEEIHTADYFLLNTRLVDLAVNKYGGVLTRGGRGSSPSFYINRILGMTQLDRFKINLPIYPDRFASTARLLENRSLPDIDFNVESQEPFQNAARELLGEHGCYPMFSPGNMQIKEAFKNICRSKDISFDKSNEISKDIDKYREDSDWRDKISEAEKYVGTIISASVHPCAQLLSDRDIRYEYGVYRFGEHLCVLVTSSEADEYKLLKDDFLIVSVWHLISETFKEVGIPIISAHALLESIKDDDRIWNLFRDGITCTLNQVDSSNGTRQARQYGIHSFEEGAFVAAAIRPSFDSWREQFLNRETYSTGSKQLDDVLKATGGYILYQESLMTYFQWLGVTPGESIGLIKKISKKKIHPEDFQKLEERIRKVWIQKTGSDSMFNETWALVQSCMSYGFCSAHAAATSLDMCYGAYLKIHYPLQYYTVCLNTYETDEDKTKRLIKELSYFGIHLTEIKFRLSRAHYSYDTEKNEIRKGMSSIKYISEASAEELYSLKDEHFEDFIDLLNRIKDKNVDSRQLDTLIKIDFFSEFGEVNALLKIYQQFEEIYGRKQIRVCDVSGEKRKLSVPEYLVAKYAEKRAPKTFQNIDSVSLLKEWVQVTEYPKTTVLDLINYQLEFLGYISYTNSSASPEVFYVTGISGYSKNMLSLYRIQNGDIISRKVKYLKGLEKIGKGDIIKVTEETIQNKWQKVGEDAKGKPVFKRLDEKETVITGYEIRRKGDN